MIAWVAVAAVLWSGDAAVEPLPAAVEPLPAGIQPLPAVSDPGPEPPPVRDVAPALPADLDLRPVVRHPFIYTALETALVLGGGTVWYLRNGTDERWGRALEWESWKRKLLADDVTFDGDRFNTNAIGHPIGGTAYYQIARGNGLGPGASFVSTVFASTFWEYLVELPEHPSINDMVMTPFGGAIIGETTYRLGRYLASGSGGARCLGAFLFAPVAALNDRPICRAREGLLPWAQLGLTTGIGRTTFDGNVVKSEVALALGSEIVAQRVYQRPGSGAVTVLPGQWSRLYLDTRWGDTRLAGLWFHASTVWAGRYDRNYGPVGSETDIPIIGARPRGWGTLIGLGSTFDYRLRDLPTVHDRVTTLGLGGPMFELATRSSVLVRASLSAQYAFAIIGSMAFRAEFPNVTGQMIKTSLRDAGYYYAHGVTSAATVTVDLGPVGFTGDARAGWYWSIDSGDPAQSTFQRDVLLRDSRIYLTGAMWSRPSQGFRLGLVGEHVRRTSYMLDSSVLGTEVNILGTAAFGF